jgi:hypothetical protein
MCFSSQNTEEVLLLVTGDGKEALVVAWKSVSFDLDHNEAKMSRRSWDS